MRMTFIAAGLGAALAVAAPALAAPAIDLFTPGSEYPGGLYTLGFEFSVGTAQSIYQLGVYDDLGDGLATGADIGLWDTSGNLLTSATIAPGGGTLNGLFRYTAITPYALTIGQHYYIGAFTNDLASSLGTGQGGTGAVNPLVTVYNDRFSDFNSLFSFPDQTNNTGGAWLGGNFDLSPSVPEPATWALMIGGFAMTGFAARRRRTAVTA